MKLREFWIAALGMETDSRTERSGYFLKGEPAWARLACSGET